MSRSRSLLRHNWISQVSPQSLGQRKSTNFNPEKKKGRRKGGSGTGLQPFFHWEVLWGHRTCSFLVLSQSTGLSLTEMISWLPFVTSSMFENLRNLFQPQLQLSALPSLANLRDEDFRITPVEVRIEIENS